MPDDLGTIRRERDLYRRAIEILRDETEDPNLREWATAILDPTHLYQLWTVDDDLREDGRVMFFGYTLPEDLASGLVTFLN